MVNKKEHTKEEAEAILQNTTPEEYKAFFHGYQKMEMERDRSIPDWEDVDAPF